MESKIKLLLIIASVLFITTLFGITSMTTAIDYDKKWNVCDDLNLSGSDCDLWWENVSDVNFYNISFYNITDFDNTFNSTRYYNQTDIDKKISTINNLFSEYLKIADEKDIQVEINTQLGTNGSISTAYKNFTDYRFSQVPASSGNALGTLLAVISFLGLLGLGYYIYKRDFY